LLASKKLWLEYRDEFLVANGPEDLDIALRILLGRLHLRPLFFPTITRGWMEGVDFRLKEDVVFRPGNRIVAAVLKAR